jgi:hypothetical protein
MADRKAALLAQQRELGRGHQHGSRLAVLDHHDSLAAVAHTPDQTGRVLGKLAG